MMNPQANTAKVRTVIAARPGAIREALQAALTLYSRLEICGVAGGGLSALDMVRHCQPALLIIDTGLLEDEIAMLLKQVKQEQPQIRCLVLAETNRQGKMDLTMGADAVVLRSDPTERLAEALDNMGLW